MNVDVSLCICVCACLWLHALVFCYILIST